MTLCLLISIRALGAPGALVLCAGAGLPAGLQLRIRSVKLVRTETNVDAGVFCHHEPTAHRADIDSVVCLGRLC